MTVVGLSGWARSGKDTVGAILVSDHGFTRAALADPLKKMAVAIDPIVGGYRDDTPTRLAALVECVGWEHAKENAEVRGFLQRLGTEGVRRTLGEDTWVEYLFSTFSPEGRYVVTDIRFPNEALAVTRHGGHVVRVSRSSIFPGSHESERALDDWNFDYWLANETSLDDLAGRVAVMVAELGL